MLGFEAWENELFDKYNGEGRMTEDEFWADEFAELAETEVFEDDDEE